jgi:ATP-binding cassette subfamily C (CFTR/MRP) protein 1
MDSYLGIAPLELRTVNSTAYMDDSSFGPFLEIPGKATFDFTLLFEETILSIAPSSLLLLSIPTRILRLWKSPRKVIGSYLLTTKIVCFRI